MEPTPTAALDRHNDRVYDSTTSVVRAVMALSQGVQAHHANLYLPLGDASALIFSSPLPALLFRYCIVLYKCVL